jgi:mutual gliding-motility protein MglA
MPVIQHEQKVVLCKVTYWGPHLSGKTTSIAYIHSKTSGGAWEPEQTPFEPSLTSAMRRLRSEVVTVTHDYLPIQLGEVRGYKLSFGLYGPTGLPPGLFPQARASRKLMAKGTDVFVFVASSMPQDQDANLTSLDELRNLEEASGVPIVFQLNKQDLPDAIEPDLLKEMFEVEGELAVPSSAIHGTGVFDALKTASRLCLQQLSRG